LPVAWSNNNRTTKEHGNYARQQDRGARTIMQKYNYSKSATNESRGNIATAVYCIGHNVL
jgi:hypothetical protein